ncbi:MAG: YscQ/HrcQ family type III secretion apparatus protein [Nitrosomonas sp.]|nr:MAG: YscQ/HrcQ family type III secretion apparatus protein [Nitrosomonas sp.]
MTTMTSGKSYDWLRVIEPELVKLQDVAAIGGPDDFSWDALNQLLAERFEIPDLAIRPTSTSWQSEKELASYVSKHPWVLNVAFSSLPGSAALVMSDKDVETLMATLLTKKSESIGYSNKDFQTGFYHFLGAVLANTLEELGFTDEQALSVLESKTPPNGPGICLEVDITLCETTIKGRLVATEDLLEVWKQRFAASASQALLLSPAAQNFEVVIHLEAGKVTMPSSRLKTVHVGDYVILDSCTVLPGEEKGRVMLTINDVPVFRGMLKQNKIKVLEYPLYHKADTPMDQDNTFEDEEVAQEEGIEPFEEGEEEGGKMEPAPPIGERAKDIPMTITVEVGRIQMKLEKLMQLQPGQLLELDVDPAEGVDLVVSGRCIGKGELLRLGEALGVRILELS